ncbi:SubName: Full=Uncharacterized protein {ECO:0000313/EMBL:CCA68370.1} [Serendipita indica DSM 11827]|uniref:RING-type domain-containing protein n=1 Tax=Serendipita indica (strain DSM 11827) TaxID=1109443 RepID=G4TAL9_SERID|nr:SubName: Full=Uncharacterized protein {ECO:0000313/EMBL:CCA68370.1} [Serendipita indica DSM 11827]CCA68370.1 hypothetical protein PIIN_02236 [Serendipita indica DSM 11827]
MLTIDPTSVCDVCGDQYGVVCLPYLIPCGHTFCRNCLVSINDNNPKGAACPLCREGFNIESICLVRVDPADPLPKLSYEHFLPSDDTDSDLSDRVRSPWNQEARIREEARALELRVSKAASVKCTFEEVSELRDDIQNWLLTEPKYKPNGKIEFGDPVAPGLSTGVSPPSQVCIRPVLAHLGALEVGWASHLNCQWQIQYAPIQSPPVRFTRLFPALRLSAALLRAILLNSLAYTESSKTAQIMENGLRERIKALEAQQTVLEADVRRCKQQYSEKQHECLQLQAEVERLRKASPGAAAASRLHSSPFPGPASPTSPTAPTPVSSPPPSRYVSSPETQSARLAPPRSVTTSPTRINPYAPTSLPSIASATSSRSSSAASSASSSPSPQPAREFFTPQSARQTSPAPSPIPYATRPTPKSGLETLMARTAAQSSVPRSMTAPLPPGGTPPPIRNQTRPRPIQTPRQQAYPKVWLPMIDDTEDASAAENTYTYSNLARHGSMLRTPATPTPTSVRR